jgi:hypothetical protein
VTAPDATDPVPVPLLEPSLAARQEALVRALVAGGPVPVGMDGARVAVTARTLVRKRARVVVGVWPALRTVENYEQRFVDWAGGRTPASATADGAAFALALGSAMPLPVAVELVAARRRRWVRADGGVVLRLFGAVRTLRAPGSSPSP